MQGFLGKVRQLAWSDVPNRLGVPLLASSSSNGIIVWQRSADETIGWSSEMVTHEEQVLAIAFQPKTSYLASAGADGSVCLWYKGQRLVQTLKGAANGFTGLQWSHTGDQLLAGGNEGEILVWSQSQCGKGFGS